MTLRDADQRCGNVRLSRRQALAVGTAVASGYFVGYANAAQDDDFDLAKLVLTDQACTDAPTVLPNMTISEMTSISAVERVIARDQGGMDEGIAAAPSFGAGEIAAGAPSTPEARAAYESNWVIPDQKFRIEFINGAAALKKRVLEILNDEGWRKGAYLDFVDAASMPGGKPHVRLQFLPGLNKSHIGTASRGPIDAGQPSMYLGFQPSSTVDVEHPYGKFLVLHEFGHALGLIHEHQQPGSELQFKEDDSRVLAHWRRALGGVDDNTVRFNVFRRWKNFELTKFVSKYDIKSIMNYAFPAWMFLNNREVIQNFVLSHLDLAFAGIVYPTPSGPKVPLDEGTLPPSEEPSPSTPFELAIDGAAAQARLVQNGTLTAKLKVAPGQGNKPYTIYSEGSTQVVLQLLGPNDVSKDATPTKAPGHGTYDLTNDVIQATLVEGEYVLKVQHVSSRGGGQVTISVKSGEKFGRRLLESNRTTR